MELHVNLLVSVNMPIVLISTDSVNNSLSDFKNMTNQIDIVIESTDPRSRVISNYINENTLIINRLSTESLSPRTENESDEDVYIRFQAVVNTMRSLNVSNGIIISHHNVINTWKPDIIDQEWQIIEM